MLPLNKIRVPPLPFPQPTPQWVSIHSDTLGLDAEIKVGLNQIIPLHVEWKGLRDQSWNMECSTQTESRLVKADLFEETVLPAFPTSILTAVFRQGPNASMAGMLRGSRVYASVFSGCSRVRLFATPWDSPGTNPGVGCHFLLPGVFPTQGSNRHLLRLLHFTSSLLLSYQGRPFSKHSWQVSGSHRAKI